MGKKLENIWAVSIETTDDHNTYVTHLHQMGNKSGIFYVLFWHI